MADGSNRNNLIEIIEIKKNYKRNHFKRDEIIGQIPKEKLLKIYGYMLKTRALDEKIDDMMNRGYSIMQHPTYGQEAGPISSIAALEDDDYIFPYHRGWAWAIGKGMEPKFILAELLGKKTGYCKGKGGPHLASYELKVMGRSGIQGAHIPIAAGAGLAIKYKNEKKAIIAFFGEGASDTGNFHEGLNLASIWKAPVIYFTENNLYMQFDRSDKTTSVKDISLRALSYDIPGYIVDGNDAVAIYYLVSMAVENAKNGKGPSLIESKTYRLGGHTGMDKSYYGGYRSKEEVDQWREKCPIKRLENDLLRHEIIDEQKIKEIKEEAIKEVNEAENYAVNSEYPNVNDYYSDVFYE